MGLYYKVLNSPVYGYSNYSVELESGITLEEWLQKCPKNVFVRIKWENLWVTIHTSDMDIMRHKSNCVLEQRDIEKWLDMEVKKATGDSDARNVRDVMEGLYSAEVEIG